MHAVSPSKASGTRRDADSMRHPVMVINWTLVLLIRECLHDRLTNGGGVFVEHEMAAVEIPQHGRLGSHNQEWRIGSPSGLNQVYFSQKKTGLGSRVNQHLPLAIYAREPSAFIGW
jgi:hypothetical protein